MAPAIGRSFTLAIARTAGCFGGNTPGSISRPALPRRMLATEQTSKVMTDLGDSALDQAKKKGVIPDETVQRALDDPMATWEEAKGKAGEGRAEASDDVGKVYEKEQNEEIQERSRMAEMTTD